MMLCRFCSKECFVFLDMSHIPFSVTSDSQLIHSGFTIYQCKNCKLIQKNATEELQKKLFENFISHALGDGEEQIKFVNGHAFPRSELILASIEKHLAKSGEIIDLGTGSGSFLKSFQKKFPNWTLYAQDIQANSLEQLQRTVKKENIYIEEISSIEKKFDCISLIHLLGHIVSLKEFVQELKNISKKDAQIIIQTPDLQSGFFDVVIKDQITHFTQDSLYNTLSKEFSKLHFTPSIIKELTLTINLLPQDSTKENTTPPIEEVRDNFKNFINFLHKSKESYVVLGCAPASTYIGAILAERLLYFVDEDETKISKLHLAKKIKRFDAILNDETIILPFLDTNIVANIKNRYKSLRFISFEDI